MEVFSIQTQVIRGPTKFRRLHDPDKPLEIVAMTMTPVDRPKYAVEDILEIVLTDDDVKKLITFVVDPKQKES